MKKVWIMLLVAVLALSGAAYATSYYNWGNTDLMPLLGYAFDTTTGHNHDGTNSRLLTTLGTVTAGALSGLTGIDGTPVGASTPSTGKFTTLQTTGATTVGSTVAGPGTGFGNYSLRTRVTVSQLNAGITLVAAATGLKYRVENVKLIAYGGALTSTNATHVELRGTQSSSVVALYKVAKAQMTQSAVNTVGTTSTIVLADGASFIACDANTALTLNPLTGTDFAGATGVDVLLDYAVES